MTPKFSYDVLCTDFIAAVKAAANDFIEVSGWIASIFDAVEASDQPFEPKPGYAEGMLHRAIMPFGSNFVTYLRSESYSDDLRVLTTFMTVIIKAHVLRVGSFQHIQAMMNASDFSYVPELLMYVPEDADLVKKVWGQFKESFSLELAADTQINRVTLPEIDHIVENL